MRKLTHDEISKNRSSLDKIHTLEKLPVTVLLNSIRSSYNVGSIFRTSDGAMIEKLILCGYTPYPPIDSEHSGNKDVLKTALGSTQSVRWEYLKDPIEAIKNIKIKVTTPCKIIVIISKNPSFIFIH